MRLVLLALVLCTGCARLTWRRESRYEPVPIEAAAGLAEARSDLGQCLAAFGAPLWVWEHATPTGSGTVLAYGWFDARDWGFRVSVPVARYLSASFDYDRLDARMRGLVLFFDPDWKLSGWRSGLLRDVTRDVRPPPAFEDDDGAAGV